LERDSRPHAGLRTDEPNPAVFSHRRGGHEPTHASEIIDLIGSRDVFSVWLEFDEMIFPIFFVKVVRLDGEMMDIDM
jgi:hypothetical protein